MILLDGQLCDSPLLLDRGLAYGDGLFETIAVRDGQPLAWTAHMARLARGCAVLGVPMPNPALLLEETMQLSAGHEDGVIKILITRGSGGRGYRPADAPVVRRIVSLHPWPLAADEAPEAPVRVWVCHQRLGHQPQLAGIKHLNRLEQVLASAEWPAPYYFEGLMLDFENHLIEGIRSNVFVVQGETLLTPDLSRCGIAGVVRAALLEIAPRHGLVSRVGEVLLAELEAGSAMFLCNSVMGLRSVTRIDQGDDSMALAEHPVVSALAASLRQAGVIP